MTNADGLITIDGLTGYFSDFSGVKIKTTRPTYSDGLTNIKRKAGSGATEYQNVTCKRSFDPDKDGDVVDWADRMRCSLDTADITARPVTRCGGITRRGTKAWRLSGCRIETFETFEINTADGNNVVMLSLEFTVEQAAWG